MAAAETLSSPVIINRGGNIGLGRADDLEVPLRRKRSFLMSRGIRPTTIQKKSSSTARCSPPFYSSALSVVYTVAFSFLFSSFYYYLSFWRDWRG